MLGLVPLTRDHGALAGGPPETGPEVAEGVMSGQREAGGRDGRDGRGGTGRGGGSGRRAVLLAAAAAGAGAAAGLAGGPGVAQAGGSPVELGQSNTASATTAVSTSSGDGLSGRTTANGGAGVSGADASPGGGFGVQGTSANGKGVSGTSSASAGVYGQTSATGHAGVHGTDASGEPGGYGIYGTSVNGYGVYGIAPEPDAGSGGVFGQFGSGSIPALPGFLVSGVVGADLSVGNTGVSGLSLAGTGVYAASNTGTALSVFGKVQFSSAGLATVRKGRKTVTVTTSAVTASTLVLATLQKAQNGVYIAAAAPKAGSFTITLNKAAAGDLPVAWFFIG
jgi:hypothetical protein